MYKLVSSGKQHGEQVHICTRWIVVVIRHGEVGTCMYEIQYNDMKYGKAFSCAAF